MQTQLNYHFSKKSIHTGLAIAVFVIVVFLFFKNFEIVSKNQEGHSPQNLEFINLDAKGGEKTVLKNFDPNQLSSSQWQELGFSEKQVQTILKYKNIVGGAFLSKDQLKKCYAISEEKYKQLEPYILLPETKSFSVDYSAKSYGSFSLKKEMKISHKFNPDAYSEEDWMKLGFSEKQAAAIIKYKMYLGGSFLSKEKFKDCFIISPENYRKMEPYLLLPQHVSSPSNFNNPNQEKPKISYRNFNPNLLDLQDWMNLGFSEKQAQVILNYKNKNLKGLFKNLDEIKNCFVISEEKFNELKPYIQLSAEQENAINTVSQPKLETEIPKTDFSKINLNSINFKQLKEFGFDDRAAASLIGFRNKLGGFVNETQILETYNIDKELMEKLLSIATPLNMDLVKKYSLVDAPESWLKEHPYFKYSADRIIFYRISFPDEKKIFKMLHTKPEYEAKMKLYLK